MPAAGFEPAIETSEPPPRLRAPGLRDWQRDVLQLWDWKHIDHETPTCRNSSILKF